MNFASILSLYDIKNLDVKQQKQNKTKQKTNKHTKQLQQHHAAHCLLCQLKENCTALSFFCQMFLGQTFFFSP